MDAQLERQLREAMEKHVGHPLSDAEWETFKRIQLQDTRTDWSKRPTIAREWTPHDMAACIAALIAASAGVSLLYEWDFVFSPFVRIPLGIFTWLIAVAGFWFLLRIFISNLLMLLWGVLFFLVPFIAAGGALLFKDRRYLTSPEFWPDVWNGSPAELVGAGLILASIALAWTGRPPTTLLRSLGSCVVRGLASFVLRNLWWFIGGAIYVPIAVSSIEESRRPLAVTAGCLSAMAVLLLVNAVSAADAKRASAAGPFGFLLLITALGFVCADLAVEGRPREIALWLPLIAIGAVGCVLCVVAVVGEGSWRTNWPTRISRALVGLVALAPAVCVAGALGVSPW